MIEETEATDNGATESTKKNDFQTAKDVGLKGLQATGRFWNKFLDHADSVDRFFFLHGGKLNWFVGLSFIIVVGSPVLDWMFNMRNDRLTAWTTIFLLLFILVMFFAWLGSLRDDEGNWSFKRVLSRIWTHIQIGYDFVRDSTSKPKEEMLYRLSITFIVGSFCWKALQNVSVVVRKLYENAFHARWHALRSFEKTTNQWTGWVFLAGLTLLIYLCVKNKKLLESLLQDFLPFLSPKKKVISERAAIQLANTDLVFNAKDKSHIEAMLNQNDSKLYVEFIRAVQKWNPEGCISEDDFQNNFHRHLKRTISNPDIQREFRIIVDPNNARKDKKADIVINDTILIEMKKDNHSASSRYVADQVWSYSSLWGTKGPVILLVCKGDYEETKSSLNPKLIDLAKADKRIIAFVGNLN